MLIITDQLGRVVSNEMMDIGQKSITKNVGHLDEGIYFVTAIAEDIKVMKRMMVVK
jgi:hypothetical protein